MGPALVYQSIMNGIRLGTYQVLLNSGITRDKDGNQNGLKCVAAGCFSGMCGAFTGSPIYMVINNRIRSTEKYIIQMNNFHKSSN